MNMDLEREVEVRMACFSFFATIKGQKKEKHADKGCL